MSGKYLVVACLVWLNILFSVLVVFLSKWIYTQYGFPNVTLTCLHFVAAAVCTHFCERIGVFHRKSLPTTDVIRFSLTFCAFVVFTNLSLQTNSVGVYLVFKIATTPTVVALEAFRCRRKITSDVLLAVVSRLVFF